VVLHQISFPIGNHGRFLSLLVPGQKSILFPRRGYTPLDGNSGGVIVANMIPKCVFLIFIKKFSKGIFIRWSLKELIGDLI